MRTKHCEDCGKCVRKYDHHCPWLEACIGERNHKFFWMFLLSTAVLIPYTLYITWSVKLKLDFESRPGTTFAVDWALKDKYRSILIFQ